MRKYQDKYKIRPLDLSIESRAVKNWIYDHYKDSCWVHTKGFYIFVAPAKLESSDEYQNKDPYSVIENLNSSFHQRRLNCTIELMKDFKGNQNLKLLDIGCGQGHFTKRYKKEFPGYDIFGLDYSITAIEYACSDPLGVEFIVADAYHPPFADEYFDILVCNNIWEHVQDPLNLLKSISRILKPKGLLIISTPSRYRFENLLRICLGKKIIFMSELHVTEYSVGQVKEQLKYGGFEVVKVYSPPIKENRFSYKILKRILTTIIKLTKSHHILEETVFFSAKKKSE